METSTKIEKKATDIITQLKGWNFGEIYELLNVLKKRAEQSSVIN
ncbi:hypothetical protein [Aequorivita vitellina]|nr:hypothetical protein [Aequorivita vitellina]